MTPQNTQPKKRHLVPIVGRGPELRELDEILARALTAKEPQTVTLVGGPGMGKHVCFRNSWLE